MNDLKVLTILGKLDMGGIEKTLLSGIPIFKKNGIIMSILCSSGGLLEESFEDQGVEIIDLGVWDRPVLDAIKLYKVLRAKNFDIVHSRHGHTSGLFAIVCYLLKKPFIISIHNEKSLFRNEWKGKFILSFFRKFYLNIHKRLSLQYATKIIGHSKANLSYFDLDRNENDLDKFEIVYNGVDFSRLKKYQSLDNEKQEKLASFLNKSKKTFIHIGSFKEQKNHSFLIDVFNGLKPIENQYRLILIGIGGGLDHIKKKVANLGIQELVLFTEMEHNIGPYLESSDIFIFPSLYEGFGNVLIEAQYKRNLICASNIKPHYESVFSGYHPFFYDPYNLEEAVFLVKKCLSSNDKELVLENAYNFANFFSITNMVSNLVSIYNTIHEIERN